jgi:hypothetical protein
VVVIRPFTVCLTMAVNPDVDLQVFGVRGVVGTGVSPIAIQ